MSVVRCPWSVVGHGLVIGYFMARPAFQNLRVYRLSEEIADRMWDIVIDWTPFDRQTVGSQLVRAADSIGANISEGVGRGSFKDNRRFVRVARGSLNETIHFLRRAYRRGLVNDKQAKTIKPLIEELGPKLNAYLKSIGSVSVIKRGERATDNGPRTTDN